MNASKGAGSYPLTVGRQIRGIIKIMAEMRDVYKLVKFISSRKYEMHPVRTSDELDAFGAVLGLALVYVGDDIHKQGKTHRVFHAAHEKGYIRLIQGNRIVITPKGTHLLGKKLYFLRVGLWDESLKQYDKTQTVLIIIITSLITAVGGVLAGYLIRAS
jgi:hypothetical protein